MQSVSSSIWTRVAVSKNGITELKRALKLVDKFIYRGSSGSWIETDINTWLAKAWTAIDRLSVIWKSDLTDKMKRIFFQAVVVSINYIVAWTHALFRGSDQPMGPSI